MFANLLLALAVLYYFALCSMILGNSNSAGGAGIGWLVADALLIIFATTSIVLTILIATKGGFNWISDNRLTRYAGIAMLWLGLMAGIISCTYIRAAWHDGKFTGLSRILSMLAYYGAAWLPLFMLVPYAILLHPEWSNPILTNIAKTVLVPGAVLGWFFVTLPKTVFTKGTFTASQTHRHDAMAIINGKTSTQDLLPLLLDKDGKVQKAALARLKAKDDLEGDLIKILDKHNPYADYWVYLFLKDYKPVHPAAFIEPVNNSITALTAQIQTVIESEFSRYSLSTELLDAELLCSVLDTHFKDSGSLFKPQILQLQKVLQMPLAGQADETKSIVERLHRYSVAVKNWVDKNQEGK